MSAAMLTVRSRAGGDAAPAADQAPWPVRHEAFAQAYRAQWRALLAFATTADEETRRVLLLGGHRLLAYAGAVTEAAMAVAGAAAAGVVLDGPDEIAFLRGEGGTVPLASIPQPAPAPAGHRFWRRAARAASWTAPWRLPIAIASPWAVAVTHNPLLRAVAKSGSHAIGFRHADSMLPPAPVAVGDADRVLAQSVAAVLVAELVCTPEIRGRAQALLEARGAALFAESRAALTALRGVALPRRLWSGSGGNFAARAIGLEVLRRGGTVSRFDHGGSSAPIHDPEGLALIELAVSSDFTAPTPELARHLAAQAPAAWMRPIRGGPGDPMFRVPRGRRVAASARPRVLYATTAVFGFRKVVLPNIADTLYIEWQIAVARALQALPVDTVLRPHPEGLFRGKPHPLAAAGPLAPQGYETLLETADVLVFDYAASTTFWAAVCTDRPIVYLDLGTVRFAEGLAPALRRRLRIVTVAFDAANRPVLDREALAAAVMAPGGGEPDEFRRAFGGEA